MANPNTDPQILAALEVVRRGRTDLADPELAQVADAVEQDSRLADRLSKIQRADEHLAKAFHEVVVPANFEQRVLDCLAADSAVSENAQEAGEVEHAGEIEHTLAERPSRSMGARIVSSRWTWSGSVAVAASVVLAFFLLPRSVPADPIPPEHLLEKAIAFFNSDTDHNGVSLSEHRPRDGFEASDLVRHTETSEWREIDDFLGYPGVAYDLVGPQGEHATLYVSRHRIEQLELKFVTQPSAVPWLPPTGGASATCWQVKERLYVLVVEGGRKQYNVFVRQPGSTVAFYWPAPVWIAQAV